MKIYMMTDLEGVAGVVGFEDWATDTHANHEARMRMHRLLTFEVNAAVEGLFAGGASEVIVNDGHGAGYTLDFEELDPRIQVVHGHERPFWLPLLDESCAGTVLVGAHAKASSPPATSYHTMSKGVKDWSINGTSFGEMGLQALIAGHFGVPMIYVSGEALATAEIEALIPGIKTTTVKRGLSRLSAVSWTAPRAREMIRRDAQEAMGLIDKVEPLNFAPPLLFRDERYEETWTRPSGHPDVEVLDHSTRKIRADDIPDLLDKMYGYDRNYRAEPLPKDLPSGPANLA